MVTTIQIHEEVKQELDKLKESSRDSYEDIIIKILTQIEKQKGRQEALLAQGYKEMAEESLRICKEFEHVDAEVTRKYGN